MKMRNMVPFSYPVVTLHLVHNPLQVDCPKTHDMKHELSNSPITFGKTGHHQGLFNVASDIWTIDSGIATLAVLAEESLVQASFQTLSQPFSGWMTKPALPI